MKKMLMAVITSLMCFSLPTFAKVKTVHIKLSNSNTVVLRGPIGSSTITYVQNKLLKLSETLPKNSIIYLFLDTPGGSVDAGMEMINTAKSIPQRVVTITNFAASMGFIAAQLLGPRVILPNGILMSHRAYGGVEGQIPGELNTRTAFITDSIMSIEKQCAARMKMSHKKYSNLIINEYWTYGEKAVEEGAADYLGKVTCDSSLQDTEVVTIQTFFGPVKVTFAKCPLITSPLKIEFEGTEDFRLSLRERLEFRNYITSVFTRKVEFVKKSIDSKKGYQLRYIQ